jgi:hypothetical protein
VPASPTVTHEHHARLQPHVDNLASTAALVGARRDAELRERLAEACAFLTGTLIQHMEAAERVLFPELERLMQNRHSMTPMRREHADIRRRIDELELQRSAIGDGPISLSAGVALRRSLYWLHATLKVHLAEEELYADIAEHGLSPEAEATLAAAMDHAAGR